MSTSISMASLCWSERYTHAFAKTAKAPHSPTMLPGSAIRRDLRWSRALVLHDLSHHTHTGHAMFGAFGDSAPDRWGRMLMRRAERQRAKAEKRPPCPLNEIDCLLGVDDETRQGALRFAEQLGGPFLAVAGHGPRVPPLVELPALLAASDRIAADEDRR